MGGLNGGILFEAYAQPRVTQKGFQNQRVEREREEHTSPRPKAKHHPCQEMP
jgi:hypothetical protein